MSFTMEDFQRQYAKEHFPQLTPQEQREALELLSPEDRRKVLQALPPEERLAGLSPEEPWRACPKIKSASYRTGWPALARPSRANRGGSGDTADGGRLLPSQAALRVGATRTTLALLAHGGRSGFAIRVRHRMNYNPSNPFIVQGDRTILVEVDNPLYAEARDALAPFAELEKSPEHIHTYRLTPLSLWNAAAAGMSAAEMIDVLGKYSKFPLPTNIAADLAEVVRRYGRVRLERDGEHLRLICEDRPLLEELVRQPKVRDYLGERLESDDVPR